jgi:tetratricopeptide (TPR) repeat protein
VNTFNVLWRQGVILGQDGNISLERPTEATAVLQNALELNEEWAQNEPNDADSRIRIAMAARELGPILRHNDPGRALAVFDHALFRLAEIKNLNPSARNNQIRLLAYSSYPLRALHRQAEARERIDKAFQLLREAKGYPAERINPDDEADAALRALGDHFAETGQPQRAADVYQELLDKTMAFKPDPQNDLRHAVKLSRTYEALAALDRRNSRPEQAAALDARRLEIWKHWQTKLPNSSYVLRQLAAAQSP